MQFCYDGAQKADTSKIAALLHVENRSKSHARAAENSSSLGRGIWSSFVRAPRAPWDLNMELCGAMIDIDPRLGWVRPPYKSMTWGLRGSEAKKRSYSGSDTPQGWRIS